MGYLRVCGRSPALFCTGIGEALLHDTVDPTLSMNNIDVARGVVAWHTIAFADMYRSLATRLIFPVLPLHLQKVLGAQRRRTAGSTLVARALLRQRHRQRQRRGRENLERRRAQSKVAGIGGRLRIGVKFENHPEREVTLTLTLSSATVSGVCLPPHDLKHPRDVRREMTRDMCLFFPGEA